MTAASERSALFAAMGLLEGLVWWWIGPFDLDDRAAAEAGISLVFLTTSALLVGRFVWTGRNVARWAAIAGAAGLAVGAVTWSVWSHLPGLDAPYAGDEVRIPAWLGGAFVFLYVLTPFAQIYQRSGRWRFPYSELFDHSWNNFFVGLVAAGFTAALWIVLLVWWQLFALVGISFFREVFTSDPFAYLCTFTVFGLGLAVGRSSEAVISALRGIALAVGRILLPLVAFVALLFAVTLPVTGLDPLWETGSATPLMLVLLALFVLLLNAVFEDGSRPAPYPRIVRFGVEAGILLMPLYAAIAVYGTSLRVSQYGLTPERVYALVFAGVASLYAVGYAASTIWRRAPWIGHLRGVNVGAALIIASVAVLIQLWPLDPLRLSAESQVRRLVRGSVGAEAFDFATLRFRLGHHGWRGLEQLEGLQDHPEIAAIRRSIASVREASSGWAAQERVPEVEPTTLRYHALPDGVEVPMGVEEIVSRDRVQGGRVLCGVEDECLILAADLDADGQLEFCLLADPYYFHSACYRGIGSQWSRFGQVAQGGAGERPTRRQIERWYRDVDALPTAASPYRDLVLPEGRLQIVPFTGREGDR